MYRFLKELAEDAKEFVVDHVDAFEARILQSLDLLLDQRLKCTCANKQGGSRTLRNHEGDVVQQCCKGACECPLP